MKQDFCDVCLKPACFRVTTATAERRFDQHNTPSNILPRLYLLTLSLKLEMEQTEPHYLGEKPEPALCLDCANKMIAEIVEQLPKPRDAFGM